MKDVVIVIGRFRASLWAGLVFLLAAIVAGLGLEAFIGALAGPGAGLGLLLPLASAVVFAFPLGAMLGYPILHSEKILFLSRVTLRGVAVPFLTSSLVVIGLYAAMFVSIIVHDPNMLTADSYWFLMPLYFLFSGPLTVQAFTGWITYPCGFCAAYAIHKLRIAKGVPSSRTIVLYPGSAGSVINGVV